MSSGEIPADSYGRSGEVHAYTGALARYTGGFSPERRRRVFVTLFVLNTSPDYPSGLNDGHPRGGRRLLGRPEHLRLPHNDDATAWPYSCSAAGRSGGGGGGSARAGGVDACRTADAMRAHTHAGKVRGGETTGTFGCSCRLAPGSPRAVHCRPGLDALGARLRAAGVNVKTAKDHECVLP